MPTFSPLGDTIFRTCLKGASDWSNEVIRESVKYHKPKLRIMKKCFLILLLTCSTQLVAQKIVQIRGTKTIHNYVKISSIKNTEMWTEVVLELSPTDDLNGTLHAPRGESPFVIRDRQGNEHFLVYQRGWGGSDPGGYGSITILAGQTKSVTLYFNKFSNLDQIYSLNEATCEGDGCWYFNDIVLVDEGVGAKAVEPSAKFEKNWTDYNVTENGVKGMRIHASFTVYNLKDRESTMSIRFQNEDDEFLKSENSSYRNKNEELAIFKPFTPGHAAAIYSDISAFIPYSEFKLTKGEHILKMDIDLIYKAGGLIQHLKTHNFKYTKN